jgi:predicted transcriptional regulator
MDVSHDEVIVPSAKERMTKILQDQPDDSSYDELLRELAFARMIDRGLADSDAGKTISHEEMGRRIKTWHS